MLHRKKFSVSLTDDHWCVLAHPAAVRSGTIFSGPAILVSRVGDPLESPLALALTPTYLSGMPRSFSANPSLWRTSLQLAGIVESKGM